MNINANLAERNRCIVRDFFLLRDQGYRRKKSYQQLGEKYFLSSWRIRDIVCQRHKWPVEAVTVCDRPGPLSESAVVDCIIRLPGRPPVILDRDISRLYGTTTSKLNQQVKRHPDLFPEDFTFRLSEEEIEQMVSQNVIPSKSYLGGHSPYAFTQYGCNMLATVLKTEVANKRAVQIIRAFTTVEIMIQQDVQNQYTAHPVTSRLLREIYSSLWVIKQAMSASEGMEHYASSLETIMKQTENMMKVPEVIDCVG